VKGPSEREAAQAWASGNRAKRCARCGAANVQGHHIITRERLKQKAVELDVPAERLLWDRRNRLWLCRRHHDAHHARTSPIPMTVLREHAAKVFQFARELDLKPWLERRYPETDDQEEQQ